MEIYIGVAGDPTVFISAILFSPPPQLSVDEGRQKSACLRTEVDNLGKVMRFGNDAKKTYRTAPLRTYQRPHGT